MLPLADIVSAAQSAADAVNDFLGRVTVFGWVLVVAALAAAAWAWVRAASYWRQGPIEIMDFATDADNDPVKGFKAQLQDRLGELGFQPAAGVPGGSPTVDSLASAVSDSPIPQAKWVAALIKALPLPPVSTKFAIAGTWRDGGNGEAELLYQLTCSGPRPSVKLGKSKKDPSELADCAARQIYRDIGTLAPDLYPRWACWDGEDGLAAYINGLEELKKPPASGAPRSSPETFAAAKKHFDEARGLDPRNMLCRLRSANCLERIAGDPAEAGRRSRTQLQALKTYLYIGRSHEEIFEPPYRASVLMSALADACSPPEGVPLEIQDDVRNLLATLGIQVGDGAGELAQRLEDAARHEAKRARARLRPEWTVVHEGRLRHRFEPRGRERRQLRKALGISHGCLRLRELDRQRRRAAGHSWYSPPGRRRLWMEVRAPFWRAIVFWRLALRPERAGWTAQYNAASYYALLPRATKPGRGRRSRRLALQRLEIAVRIAPTGEFPCGYVQDLDKDLATLRQHCPTAFERVLRSYCPEEVVVHYSPTEGSGPWELHSWNEQAANVRLTHQPVGTIGDELTYRVPVADESASLVFQAISAGVPPSPAWTLVPQDYDTNVWVYGGDKKIHRTPIAPGRDVPRGGRMPSREKDDELYPSEAWFVL